MPNGTIHSEPAKPTTTTATNRETEEESPRTREKQQNRPRVAELVEPNTRSEARGKEIMGNYAQKQRNGAEHCPRSRSQQQPEGDHTPDALERQIEKWMGQEGVTTEDIKQTHHTENVQRKRKRAKHVRQKTAIADGTRAQARWESRPEKTIQQQLPPGPRGRTFPTKPIATATKFRRNKKSPEKMANSKTN